MKKIRIILIITIIILSLLIIVLANYSKFIKMEKSEQYKMEESLESALQNKIYPNNFTEFYFKYEGSINTSKIYTRFHDIVIDALPKLYSDVDKLDSTDKIKEYFNEQKYISNLGIYNIEDFEKLINILEKFNGKTLEYVICEVEKSSTIIYSNRAEFNLKIEYKDNQFVRLNVIVYNDNNNVDFIKIIPIAEE